MRRLRRCLCTLLGVVVTGGCAASRAPSISVGQVAITEASDEAAALVFALDVRNPNKTSLELYEFRYTLAVDGKHVYTGRRAPDATLGSAATRRMTLPAVIPYRRLGWSAEALPPHARYALSGKLVYVVPSTIAKILFDSGVRRPRSTFSDRGEIVFP
jgi:hypothetical protein